MSNPGIQARFFEQVKNQLPPHLSLVDEIADLLEVSTDSAYRRLRGETACTFDEIRKMAIHFRVSVDQLMQVESEFIPFSYTALDEAQFTFEDYLRSIVADLQRILSFEPCHILYQANDLPFFHLLEIPEVAGFKLFFWEKTLLDFRARADEKYTLQPHSQELMDLCAQARELYCRIPTTEIYDSEAINYTLKQIEYYYVSGLFARPDDAMVLLDKLEEAVNHMEQQARYGRKFSGREIPEAWRSEPGDNYTLYFNEVMHSDNTFLVTAGPNKIAYRTNNGLDSLSTTDEHFFDTTLRTAQVLMRRSTLISGTSEKERNKVFLSFRKRIEKLRATLD